MNMRHKNYYEISNNILFMIISFDIFYKYKNYIICNNNKYKIYIIHKEFYINNFYLFPFIIISLLKSISWTKVFIYSKKKSFFKIEKVEKNVSIF